MTQIVALRTKAELSAAERVASFIALTRDQLTNLIPTADWAADAWDVSAAFVRKGKPRAASRLYFFQHGSLVGRADKATGTPFRPAFRDFAKAYIRYAHSSAPMVFERLVARLRALGHTEAAFRTLGVEPAIHLLSPGVLTRAVQIGTEGVTPPGQVPARGGHRTSIRFLRPAAPARHELPVAPRHPEAARAGGAHRGRIRGATGREAAQQAGL